MDLDRLTRVEREALRAAATRALVECCDECRDLLRAQLQAEVALMPVEDQMYQAALDAGLVTPSREDG